ncbi:MAG: Zinc-binding dehydrogenase [Dehalococcoidia bacterium]|nr:Zinc-binding dehydrogenase [Dehalococcoidia bacterium]
MLAAFSGGKEKIEVRETPVPAPGPGEVLLRVRACGICGSDLHFYRGQLPMPPVVSPGHEFAGEVVEVGEGVEGFPPGRRVVVEPLRVCRRCSYCRTGDFQLCPRRVLLGTFASGGLAEYVLVPDYTLYPLPDALDFELGALVEPLAVVVHGLHLVDLAFGDRVVILGCGTIGVMTALAARALGAAEIAVTYRYEHQARAALAAGATRVVAADDASALAGDKPDVVVETVGGHAETLGQAVGLVRPGGRVSILGLFTGPVQVNALTMMLNEVRTAGAITYCRSGRLTDFETALRMIEADPERARGIITHRFPLAEADQAFRTAADKSSASIKVQVHP